MSHLTEIEVDGQSVPTLADILPEQGGALRALFIGKTPSPASVEAGHYFEGRMGKGLWKRLDDAGILSASPDGYADDALLDDGFGVTDLCKVPRPFGDEPCATSTQAGWERVNAHRRAAPAAHPRVRLQGRAGQGAASTPSAGTTRAATASTTTSCARSGAGCSRSRCPACPARRARRSGT